ncbi:MAG: hypothetical protein HYX92_17475 [Chloroflexi bacterium]|nr:hypothetical protein [Chloroflexota bacterium]
MTSEQIIQALISAGIGFIVPAALKQFWPEAEAEDSLPWLKWCIAGFVGGALGGLASVFMGVAGMGAAGIGNWGGFGVAVGILQWFALRGYRTVGTWFVFASMIGWMLYTVGGGAWGWIVSGAAVGMLQYLGLTKWKGAGWWIVANLIAWPIAGPAGVAVGTPMSKSNPALAWVVGWGVVGLVGAILLLLPLSRLAKK